MKLHTFIGEEVDDDSWYSVERIKLTPLSLINQSSLNVLIGLVVFLEQNKPWDIKVVALSSSNTSSRSSFAV